MSGFRTLLSLAVAAMLHNLALATEHTVGDPGGWDTTTNLQDWASSNIFLAGDDLIFDYKQNHNVLEVSKVDYDNCKNSKPIQKYSGGKTSIHLGSAGKRYFICGTSGHCSQGMKIEISTFAPAFPPTDQESWPPMVGPSFPPDLSAQPDVPTWVPTVSPSNPPTGNPTNSFPPGFIQPPPSVASSAAKVEVLVGFATGFSFVIMVLLFL